MLILLVGWMLPKIDARLLIAAGFIITALATFHIARKLGLSIGSMDATNVRGLSIGRTFVPVRAANDDFVPGYSCGTQR